MSSCRIRVGLAPRSVVVATGTFLNGTIHTGRRTYSAGRAGEPASIELAESLKRRGFPVGRLKTGTPPRLDGRTIDWDAFEPQPPDEKPVPFLIFDRKNRAAADPVLYRIYERSGCIRPSATICTNRRSIPARSRASGPRYCPSIEDKVVKFADKDRHQLFLEPEGHNTNEVYLNGFSTSLPSELQLELVRMIDGFEIGQDNPSGLCHRIRFCRPARAASDDGIDADERTFPCRPDKRHDGL